MTAPARLTQVLLQRASGPARGIKQDVFWIDARFAKKGRYVRDLELEEGPYGLKPADSTWLVAEVYNTKDFADVDKQRAVWKRWAEVLG